MVVRKSTETASAQPARATVTTPSQSHGDTPKQNMATPQATSAYKTARPGLRTLGAQPLSSDPSAAPIAGAAVSSPKARGPPWNRTSAMYGKSETGSPSTVASQSDQKVP